MQGTLESPHAWCWTSWGKHPVGKDYIHLNSRVPLLKAFSDWVEKGYQILISYRKDHSHHCSWRFWASGTGKETLVCGVGKDSSDSMGRPYPLFIAGIGPLQGWKNQWDLLPLACEDTWRQIEALSIKRFKDVKQLTGEVSTIRPPYPRWTEYMSQRGGMAAIESESFNIRMDTNKTASWDFKDFMKKISGHIEKPEFIIPLHDGPFDTPSACAAFWHQNLKSAIDDIPTVIFLGGSPGEPYLVVFRRPLMPHDFVRLWEEPE